MNLGIEALLYHGVMELCFLMTRLSCFRKDEDLHELRVGTADLLDMLREEEPETDFTFCLGMDAFADLTNLKWKRSEHVLSLGRFVVIDRLGYSEGDRIIQERQTASSYIRLLRIPTLDMVSSTMIRSCRDEETLQSLLAPAVLDYIKEHKMYRFAEADTKDT
jgi:nicotinic acid mononucleotide adenylyltransferase